MYLFQRIKIMFALYTLSIQQSIIFFSMATVFNPIYTYLDTIFFLDSLLIKLEMTVILKLHFIVYDLFYMYLRFCSFIK